MRRTRRYWSNIGIFTLLVATTACGVLYGWILYTTVSLTRATIHPPYQPESVVPPVLNRPYEDVAFTADDGITLRGWYVPSQNGAAIIFGNGIGAAQPQGIVEANLLIDHGYGVLLFFWRGMGLSDPARVTIGEQEQRDLEAALAFVQNRPDVNPERIGAIGFSMGAAVVAEVAAKNDAFKAVILEAGFPTLEEASRHLSGLVGFVSRNTALLTLRYEGINVDVVRPIDRLCAISPRPVFLIYGSGDSVVPPGTAGRMQAAACDPVEYWLIEGASHGGYSEVEPLRYPARILAFFDRALLEDHAF